MKKIIEFCRQPRPYADSVGKCVLLLEDGDNEEEIIKDFTRDRNWYEMKYSNPQKINYYTWIDRFSTRQEVRGNLLVFDTTRVFLD